jgi:hypothetical protein
LACFIWALVFAAGSLLDCGRLQAETPTEAALGLSAPNDRMARRLNFENDVTPILSRYSCNSSGCHGKAEGQNGFKLSVFGFDAQADYDALVKQGRGRRVSPAAPAESLLLAKASGGVPHGGGVRIAASSREYRLLADWIEAGLPFGAPDDPKVTNIRLEPRERLLAAGDRQPLRVTAHYSDGREEDVTGLARFQSNNETVATVDEAGLVTVGDVPGQSAVMAAYNGYVDVFTALVPQAPSSVVSVSPQTAYNFIDDLVNAKLARLNIAPSGICDDATFLRRVTLDLLGTLPTADEARTFLDDPRPGKRARWVESLFNRPEFADFWALKWSDLLRVDREALGPKAAREYYQWIRQSFAGNKPFDEFARELLTADGPLVEQPQGAFYQVVQRPGDRASTVSQVFLGVRIACAECHHHPYDRWSQTDYYGMTAYFAPLRQKSTPRGNALSAMGEAQIKHPRTGEPVPPRPLGEASSTEPAGGDRRVELAAWLTKPDNPWFARNMANRLWAHFLGRGLVEPVDDVRATNPPSNPELLDALAQHFVEHRYDVRGLMRIIVSSAAYQRATTPSAANERDEQNYSRGLFKRLDAEVLLDAVCQATGVPEKFPGTPLGSRAVQLWDSRASHYFLRIFGRPLRSTACSCERSVEPNVAQVLHLLNSPEIDEKLRRAGGRLAKLSNDVTDDRRLVEELYLTFYSRMPSDDERLAAGDFLRRPGANRGDAVQDLAWSLLNTLEFTFNH